jgi:[protein-PII] uridylyltransferase
VLVQREAHTISDARSFFWRVRNRLHKHAGRRSDRLTFDLQEELCRELGYGDDGAAVETMMSDYYRHARAVSRAREVILHRAGTPPRKRLREEDLGTGLKMFDGQLTLGDPAQLVDDPSLAMRLFATAVDRNVPVYPYARDAVARSAAEPSWCESLRTSSDASRLFVQLCTTAKETRLIRHSVLAELHDVGLLVAMVPEFAPVIGRVHHDVYHVYTVDVHSVAAVDRLCALARGDLVAEFPLACRLAAEVSTPNVLYLATLLHDVGKAIGGRDHAVRGAEMARHICARLGLAQDDIEQIAHLVEQHLVMYHLATRRDLDDPATIDEFARVVREREGLRELYLLTVADISTTSPTAMTSWKARMLDDLFHAADALLSGQAHASAHDRRLLHIQSEVLARTPDAAGAQEFLSGMPERYLLANAPASIAAHIAIANRARDGGFALDFLPGRQGDTVELCIVAPDRPGLLAIFAAAITANRLEIQAAQIHSHTATTGGSRAVDVFWVRGSGAEAEEIQRTQHRLTQDIAAMLDGKTLPSALLEGRARPWSARPAPAVRDEVIVDERASSRQTVIEVITRDRPGLVFALAEAVHGLGLTIMLAKINTEGARVADVFYVAEQDGSKLSETRAQTVREALRVTLETIS